jgi:hypothetical protein
MGIPEDEELLPAKHRLQEVVPGLQLCSKFLARVQGRSDRPAESRFGTAKRQGELG